MRSRTPCVVLDLRDVGRDHRGVARALREIGHRLLVLDPNLYHGVCSEAGVALLDGVDPDRLTVIRPYSQAVFEQLTLPAVASRLGARAVYSHRECGALWGPPLLLHVTEDPEIRWRREPVHQVTSHGRGREMARRVYSRLLMNRALRRARVVTSTRATAVDLERRHRLPADRVTVVPLGVDLDHFRPGRSRASGAVPYLFHLSSVDPREGTLVVVDAFAQLVAHSTDPVRLVLAGELGNTRQSLIDRVATLGLEGTVEIRGRVSDGELADLYSGAAATVQASTHEGFGLQALEALACGSLLIAAPAAATQEVASNADVEWTEIESAAMAAAFERAVHDPARRDRATTVNREAASRFTWDATARHLDELLREMADAGQPA